MTVATGNYSRFWHLTAEGKRPPLRGRSQLDRYASRPVGTVTRLSEFQYRGLKAEVSGGELGANSHVYPHMVAEAKI